MSMQRLIQRSIPFAAVALVAAVPAAAFAQRGQEIFEWNGRVDREIQISMRGNRLATRDIGNSETGRASSRVMMPLPQQDGQVYVQLLNGRGTADVVQQPSAQNGYTTTIRIQDPSSGADNYRIAAYWQNYANGDVYSRNGNVYGANGNNGRGRADRRRDDDDDRDRDRNRDDGYNNRRGSANVYGGANGQYANQTMLHWSGNVDGELEIRVQNGRVQYRNLSGQQPTSIRADLGNAGGQRIMNGVSVVQNQGRGSVTIVEQPSSYNGYTTVIRVRDPQGGYGFYDFNLIMQ